MKRLGVPLAWCWRTLALKSYKPMGPTGLFIQISLGEFVLSEQAERDQVLLNLLEPDAEFLLVALDGKPMRFHNIKCFSDCLDYDKSKWRSDLVGKVPGGITHPRFIPEKVPVGRMFRLMEYPGPRYTATEPKLSPKADFYQWYHQQNYTGLLFRQMWDSGSPDDLCRF